MLCLSVNEGESVYMQLPSGEAIQVKLICNQRGRPTRLGFDAPRNVRILRGELIGRTPSRFDDPKQVARLLPPTRKAM